MGEIFKTVLNMSVTGAFVVAALFPARFALKKIHAPKWISYALWAVAGFRLAIPFSFESAWSFVPRGVTEAVVAPGLPISNALFVTNSTAAGAALGASAEYAAAAGGSAWAALPGLAALAWIIGAAAMAVYGVVSITRLRRRLRGAVCLGGNLYERDDLKTPFVLGLLNPKIYIPKSLAQNERRYVILHERTHIKRGDHIVKFAAYLLLCVHWFNPFAWAAFIIMGADMEMSCDERVLREMNEGEQTKAAYSMSLLRLAGGRRVICGSPLAFGEGGVKERVRNVLNFKQPSRTIVLAAVLLAVVLSAGFGLNRASAGTAENISVSADGEHVIRYGSGSKLYYGATRSFDVAWHLFPETTAEEAIPLYETAFERYGIKDTLTRDEAAELAAFYLSVLYGFVPGRRTFEAYPSIMDGTRAIWTIYVTAHEGEDAQNGCAAVVAMDAVNGVASGVSKMSESGEWSAGVVTYPGWDNNAPDLAPYEERARQLIERTGMFRTITEVSAVLAGRVSNDAPAPGDEPFLVNVTVKAFDGREAVLSFVTGQERPVRVQF